MRATAFANSVYRPDVKIPFDPGVLYRVTAVVRQTVDHSVPGTNQGFYAGLMGWAADGTTVVNRNGTASNTSHHYVAAAGTQLVTANGWTRFTGYVRGWAGAGVNGSANPTPSPQAPGVMHANVRYITPVFYVNYPAGTGTQEVSLFTIEVVETGSVGAVNIQDGAITASKIDANAINGKTITGAVVQTAASGQRITLNEGSLNKILVYDASGNVIGELSSAGLTVKGSNGSLLVLDPNATYPNLRLTTASGTNSAVINVVENTPGSANLGMNSGPFVDPVDSLNYKWRTFMGNDFYVAERVNTSNLVASGGRMALSKNTASLTSGSGGGTVALGSGTATVTASDVRVAGVLRADNISKGSASVTPTPNSPTPITLSGGNIPGNNFYAFVTANTGFPGTVVTGVGFTGVSSSGMTIWVTRTNNQTTTVHWMIIGEL
jgi:hypothetical protein